MKKTKPSNSGTFLVEQCRKISVDDYKTRAMNKLKKVFIKLTLELDGHSIDLTSLPMHHGGSRLLFIAPCCGKRVFKLYKRPDNQKIGCRSCLSLEYRCRRHKGMTEANILEDAN